jgi:nicotinate-nucleotide pyrophosphorylase (carboxylating)
MLPGMRSSRTETIPETPPDVSETVARALREDIGDADLTASLIPAERQAMAMVVSREAAILCGVPWFEAVYAQLDPEVTVSWKHGDGARLGCGEQVCRLSGPARSILTGERTALNFLQTLSATATRAREHVDLIAGTGAEILDTRKTLPGLRLAQKYAVACGGARNHRLGLYDGILIKENHISAAGSITAAVTRARNAYPEAPVEVEVESLAQLEEALSARPDVVMLDNFDLATIRQAVSLTARRVRLEASGNVTRETLRAIAETGVDYVSVGALTKDVKAVDFSMRFVPASD